MSPREKKSPGVNCKRLSKSCYTNHQRFMYLRTNRGIIRIWMVLVIIFRFYYKTNFGPFYFCNHFHQNNVCSTLHLNLILLKLNTKPTTLFSRSNLALADRRREILKMLSHISQFVLRSRFWGVGRRDRGKSKISYTCDQNICPNHLLK